jgi:hypothetical protein
VKEIPRSPDGATWGSGGNPEKRQRQPERSEGNPEKRQWRDVGRDAGQPQTAVRFRLTYSVGGHTAEFALEPVSVFNPLGKTELQRFSCRY